MAVARTGEKKGPRRRVASTDAMPSLSVVIVNFNTFELTCACVRSVAQHTRTDHEIIVVDNGSHECDPNLFTAALPQVRLVTLARNEGFARGNNAGIAAATSPIILLLNSDTLLIDNAIDKTYDFLRANPPVGLVGCKLLNEDRTEQLSSFIPMRFPLINLLAGGNLFIQKMLNFSGLFPLYGNHLQAVREQQKQTHLCDAVSGACMMVRSEVIAQCGSLDADFFLYCEETEWCRNRIGKHFRIMYFADAALVHLGGKSSQSMAVEKQMLLSSFLYNYKIGWWHFVVTIGIYAFNIPVNLLACLFVKRVTRQMVWRQARIFASLLPAIFFDIPRYGRKPGSRPAPLRVPELSPAKTR